MHRRWLTFISAIVVAVGGSATNVAAFAGFGVQAARAATIICDPGYRYVDITSLSKTYLVTHIRAIQLAPYTSFTQTVSMSKVASVTAGINGTVTASAKANAILAEAEVKASVSLQSSGTSTVTTSVTDSFNISNSSSSDRTYALYAGTLKASGMYATRVCSSSGTLWSAWEYGSWLSWTVRIDGTALCPRTRYTSTTLQYKALTLIGC